MTPYLSQSYFHISEQNDFVHYPGTGVLMLSLQLMKQYGNEYFFFHVISVIYLYMLIIN